MGARVGLWHGDVDPGEHQRLVVDPPDLLLATPESLEAMFLSIRVDAHPLLGTVRSLIVDEVHSFASDDRGWHLLAFLERIRHLTGNELQRIGLSATVGNPGQLLEWLTPRCERAKRVVSPVTETPVDPEITIDYVGSTANAATVIAGLHRGEKRLVFVDSRMRAEEITHALRSNDVTAFVTHASLGRDERRRAEQAFTAGTDCVIVATSALELGVDVGDLDRVIHIDAPASVSSFLQRLGRAERRAGTTRNMPFLTTSEESLWNAAGVARLRRTEFVEPVTGPPLPAHLLAHQLLAFVLQEECRRPEHMAGVARRSSREARGTPGGRRRIGASWWSRSSPRLRWWAVRSAACGPRPRTGCRSTSATSPASGGLAAGVDQAPVALCRARSGAPAEPRSGP